MSVRPFTVVGGISVALAVGGALWFRTVVLPRRPVDAPTPRAKRIPAGEPRPLPEGQGVFIAVNPSAGGPLAPSPAEALRAGLPAADIVELEEGQDIQKVLFDADCPVLGAAGGDGTLAAAAAVAIERDALFVPIPAGTLNHLARDLGLDNADDAIAAVRAGFAATIDVGTVGERLFVNTLTFGGYSAVVDRREQWQPRLGKWPALVVALWRELPRMRPLRLRLDGVAVRAWLGWIGNCAYSPYGFAPAWREHLDDGLLDVRLVRGDARWARTRFAFAVLTGRLQHSRVYEARLARALSVESLDGPLRLAADGETFDGATSFVVAKKPRALRVALPPSE